MASKYKGIRVDGLKVDEHRYVWEQVYGPIPEGYVIHHIDGDKRNNELDNLQLMTLAEHSRMHSLGKQLSEDTRQKLSKALKGKANKSSRKLDLEQAKEILSLHKQGLSGRKIAAMFSVDKNVILNIVNGKTYREIH